MTTTESYTEQSPKVSSRRPGAFLFAIIAGAIIIADQITKWLAVRHLVLGGTRLVLDGWLRLSLAYNAGAAFGMSLGDASRWVFGGAALLGLIVIGWLAWTTKPAERARMVALALVWGGAAGNLIDRLRSARGVVDFIDAGIGQHRFWTFNVADSAVTIGAILLIIVLGASEDEH